MYIQSLSFISKCDGLKISYSIIEPEEVKGIVQISHGMAEHKERYYTFMEYLSGHGYVTFINDHRGHGQSVKSKDDLGYFYDDTGCYIVEDLHQATLMLKEKYPNVPLTLFGHSMGSLVVRQYIKRYARDIDKLVVCGSPSENPASDIALGLVEGISKMKGDHYRPSLIQHMAFDGYYKGIKPKVDNAWLSFNKENVEKYNEDEYCGFTFTCNGFKNLFILMKEVYDVHGWRTDHLDLPILFIAGEKDPCIASEKDWINAMNTLNKIGYHNIDKHLYPNRRHEILLDDGYWKVFEDVLKFIKK